jgi:alpha,alpha-trehalose phosphorylase
MRDYDGEISFAPRLPGKVTKLRFRVTVRGQLLEVDMEPERVKYTLVEGENFSFRHREEGIELTAKSPVCERELG